jgi:hypothetical protein
MIALLTLITAALRKIVEIEFVLRVKNLAELAVIVPVEILVVLILSIVAEATVLDPVDRRFVLKEANVALVPMIVFAVSVLTVRLENVANPPVKLLTNSVLKLDSTVNTPYFVPLILEMKRFCVLTVTAVRNPVEIEEVFSIFVVTVFAVIVVVEKVLVEIEAEVKLFTTFKELNSL